MLSRSASAIVLGLVVLPVLARADDRFFESNHVKLHYTIQGQGEPVVLIHGFTVNIPMQWDMPGITKTLAQNYRVIALDNRGHGQSGKPHDPKQYGKEMAEDVIRLLDHLKIEKAHVIGYSMGAMITCNLLATHPDRLLTATLGGAAGIKKDADTKFFDELADSLDSGNGIAPLFKALTPAGKPAPTADEIQGVNKMILNFNDPKALAAVVRGFKGLAVDYKKLKGNTVPTLLIVGEIDPLKKGVDELKPNPGASEEFVVPGGDHMTALSKPEFIQHITEFLAAHRNGKAASGAAKN